MHGPSPDGEREREIGKRDLILPFKVDDLDQWVIPAANQYIELNIDTAQYDAQFMGMSVDGSQCKLLRNAEKGEPLHFLVLATCLVDLPDELLAEMHAKRAHILEQREQESEKKLTIAKIIGYQQLCIGLIAGFIVGIVVVGKTSDQTPVSSVQLPRIQKKEPSSPLKQMVDERTLFQIQMNENLRKFGL